MMFSIFLFVCMVTDKERSNSFFIKLIAFFLHFKDAVWYKRGCIKDLLIVIQKKNDIIVSKPYEVFYERPELTHLAADIANSGFSVVYCCHVTALVSRLPEDSTELHCFLKHTSGFHCKLIQNAHVTTATTTDPNIPF